MNNNNFSVCLESKCKAYFLICIKYIKPYFPPQKYQKVHFLKQTALKTQFLLHVSMLFQEFYPSLHQLNFNICVQKYKTILILTHPGLKHSQMMQQSRNINGLHYKCFSRVTIIRNVSRTLFCLC